jgi:beta-lactamase class A
MIKDEILSGIGRQAGHVGFYFKDLATGETIEYRSREQFAAASVIKLPVFMALEKLDAEGAVDLTDRITVTKADKVPICGALTLFTDDEINVDLRTLCRLMISISDNTATNVLIRYLGVDRYAGQFAEMGLKGTKLFRCLYNATESNKGVQNLIVPAEMGMLLEKVFRREFVSKPVCEEIEDTLLHQQINHKIPGYLNWKYDVAHKTGEDEGVSNDVGIVYARRPFVVCFAGEDTDVGEWEKFIRQTSLDLAEYCGGPAE